MTREEYMQFLRPRALVSMIAGYLVWSLCFDPHLPGWPQLFRTRRECRAWIEEHHGYIRSRDDLKRMGWRMPRAVMVSIVKATEEPS